MRQITNVSSIVHIKCGILFHSSEPERLESGTKELKPKSKEVRD